jgi:tetratricopeptide (TPR) repeat protein
LLAISAVVLKQQTSSTASMSPEEKAPAQTKLVRIPPQDSGSRPAPSEPEAPSAVGPAAPPEESKAPEQEKSPEQPPTEVKPPKPEPPPKVLSPQEVANAKRLYARALTAFNHGKKQEALSLYTEAIDVAPAFELAYENRCQVLYALKRFDEAVSDCNRAVALSPRSARAHLLLGYAFNSPSRALDEFTKAIELKPDWPYGYFARGNNRQSICASSDYDCLDEAIEDLEEALAHQPRYPEASLALAIVLYNRQRYAEAVKHATAAIAPRVAAEIASSAYNVRGVAHLQLGQRELAIADLQAALNANGDNAIARTNLDKIQHPENYREAPSSITLIQSPDAN